MRVSGPTCFSYLMSPNARNYVRATCHDAGSAELDSLLHESLLRSSTLSIYQNAHRVFLELNERISVQFDAGVWWQFGVCIN